MQDHTSIVAVELAKGIRKIKNKLGARQLVETYQPEAPESIEAEASSTAELAATASNIATDVSLLWPPGYTPPAPDETGLDENAIRDLGLEATISGLAMRSSGQKCRATVKQIFLHMCEEPEVLCYRQDIIEDLLNYPALITGLERLLPKLATLDQYGQADEQQISLYRVTWWLGELELYIECIRILDQVFSPVEGNLRSEGLNRLRKLSTGIQQDPTFIQLQQELPGLLARMRGVASITIGVNLDDKLQPIAATLLTVNEEEFSEAPLLKMLLGTTTGQEGVMPIHSVPKAVAPNNPMGHGTIQANPLMVPLFRDLSQVLEHISKPIAQSLKKYIQLNRRFLAALEPELAFYVGAAKMLHQVMEAGMPVCRPILAPKEERLCEIEDNFNLNLALHQLDREGQPDLRPLVVTNEVSIGPQGRIIILTGPNRGGKTTYAQAIGLTQVLAQAGLYVPGSQAHLSPVDAIYTHYPLEEKLARGTGRFGDEARRLHLIFTKATRHSLLLFNESLSGTAAGESLYLARDIVRIMCIMGTRAIFATHLHELAASVEKLNSDTEGDSRVISMVASLIDQEVINRAKDDGSPVKRSYKIIPSPPMGRSYAREIALRYGISFEQLSDLLDRRGLTKSPVGKPETIEIAT